MTTTNLGLFVFVMAGGRVIKLDHDQNTNTLAVELLDPMTPTRQVGTV